MDSQIVATSIDQKKQPMTSYIFSHKDFDDHEQVVFCHDKDTGLKAIIGVHNTVLGPALGGTRMWSYVSETEALTDVLRLSRGMTLNQPLQASIWVEEKRSSLVMLKHKRPLN